jgi:hypothetical protein
MTNEIATRQRVRAVDVEDAHQEPVYYQPLRDYVSANSAKNAAAKLEREAHKKLAQAMAHADVRKFDMVIDGVPMQAEIAEGTKDVIDMEALFRSMNVEDFLSIVSTSQSKVKDKAGSVVLAKVTSPVPTDEKLTVKKKK